jgi:hypothetical protein
MGNARIAGVGWLTANQASGAHLGEPRVTLPKPPERGAVVPVDFEFSFFGHFFLPTQAILDMRLLAGEDVGFDGLVGGRIDPFPDDLEAASLFFFAHLAVMPLELGFF